MCSAMCRGTLVISAGFQENISRLCLSKPHSSFCPSSVKLEPIAIVCSGYSGWIATWIFSFVTRLITGCDTPGPETIVHYSGIILLLRNVTVPLVTKNFSILWAVDGTARILLTLGLPIIPFNNIFPSGHIISPLNPTSGVVAGIIWDPTFGRNLLNQCSYKISEKVERITKKRTKNKAKTTKPGTEWKSCEGQSQIKAKDQKSQSQSQLNKLTVKTGAVIEEYYWLQSQPI
ncbi:hypothetical protein Tco_0931568 [Tanacetum coccineum]